jgi:hypothetical protein
MASLIINKMGGTLKSSYDVFIIELSSVFCCVIPKCPNFYPLSGVVKGYNNILITNSLSCGFNRSHFMKGSYAIIGLNGPLPLHHIGSNIKTFLG